MHREHGTRPQHHSRSMGLDERPGNPFQHLGMGHGRSLVALAVLAQPPAPHVHQRRRRGRRPRLRSPAGHPGPGVAAEQPCSSRCARCCWLPPSNGASRFHGLYSVQEAETTEAGKAAHKTAMLRKMARQAGKDYVLFPALSCRRWRRTLGANVVANGLRNAWAYIVIVCGHFADGAEKFTASVLEDETKPEWYLRQMLGTANFRAGPMLALHDRKPLLPDRTSPLPRSAAAIATRDRRAGARFVRQATTCRTRPVRCFASTCSPCAPSANWRCRIGFISATSDDAPETASENKFRYVTNAIDRHRAIDGATCGDADWRRHSLPTGIGVRPAEPLGRLSRRCACGLVDVRARLAGVQLARSRRRTWP